MKYQILKQYIPGVDTVWVGALNPNDSLEVFNTLLEAETRLTQLKKQDPNRGFKIVERE